MKGYHASVQEHEIKYESGGPMGRVDRRDRRNMLWDVSAHNGVLLVHSLTYNDEMSRKNYASSN